MNEYTFSTMNSTATLTFSEVRDPEEVAAAVRSVFEQYDHRFSRDSSAADFSLNERRAKASELAQSTHGLNSPRTSAGRPHGRSASLVAPSFTTKAAAYSSAMTAMALGSAGGFLDAAGVENWALALNGDVLVAGERARNKPWEVPVEDGSDAREPLATVKLVSPRRASKTLRSSKDSPDARDLVQVTVIADDIQAADLATVDVLAGGLQRFSQIASKWAVDAVAVDQSGSVHITGGAFAAVRARGTD